jgi:hypothetical protein
MKGLPHEGADAQKWPKSFRLDTISHVALSPTFACFIPLRLSFLTRAPTVFYNKRTFIEELGEGGAR